MRKSKKWSVNPSSAPSKLKNDKAMIFEEGYLYHIYNQGNNRQKIFFCRENYLFFLKKIKTHILPFADILAWCLMPNHFHLMVLVNEVELLVAEDGSLIHPMTLSHRMNCKMNYDKRTINNSIAIMLRSYTRAINKQNDASGSLFRSKTKAEPISKLNGVTPSYIDTNSGTQINMKEAVKQYPQVCFEYINQNPVKAGLVNKVTDWEFSSAMDYAGLRNGKLINKSVAKEYIEISFYSSDDFKSSDE